jgi:hypothetical protein
MFSDIVQNLDVSPNILSKCFSQKFFPLSVFHNAKIKLILKMGTFCLYGFLVWLLTDTCIKRWGLRASSLSAVAKADAGQNTSCNHLNPNVLYMMLCADIFSFQVVKIINILQCKVRIHIFVCDGQPILEAKNFFFRICLLGAKPPDSMISLNSFTVGIVNLP